MEDWPIVVLNLQEYDYTEASYDIFKKANDVTGKLCLPEVIDSDPDLDLFLELDVVQADFGLVEPGSEEGDETDVH